VQRHVAVIDVGETPFFIPKRAPFVVPAILLCALLLLSACVTSARRPSPVPATGHPAPTSWWHPTPGLTWQWQLTGEIDVDVRTDVIDVDLYVDQSVLDDFHSRGTRVICYVSVGSFEDWRPDKDAFPQEVLGKEYEGWSGERWLDIRRIERLAPIMRARLDVCAAKGFDAVEPDNIAVYEEDTGFPISFEENVRYARWLAEEAHARGLAIGLKNGPGMVPELADTFDFAITEEAFAHGFARAFLPFLRAGKAVFDAEYTDTEVDWERACTMSEAWGFSTILKRRSLDTWVRFCEA